MWRKVFRPRSANQKWVDQIAETSSREPIASLNDEFDDDDDGSTVGSVDSIICLPAVPTDMTEPSKALGGTVTPIVLKSAKRTASDFERAPVLAQPISAAEKTPRSSTRAPPQRAVRSGTLAAGKYKNNSMQLSDFKLVKTIGTGSFGRVYLATPAIARYTHSGDSAADQNGQEIVRKPRCQSDMSTFMDTKSAQQNLASSWTTRADRADLPEYVAVKRLSKSTVLDMKQVHHVRSEKEILEMVDHPFLVRILGKFQDQYYLYIVMEFVGGGEFFSFLRKSKRLSDEHSKFYAAHIVLIFEYLHDRCVVYRDLKPENLLITQFGYLKLTDFGFAKYLVNRTYTLCGTPEYIAPEVLLNKGHGFPVDWWALGVLIYEMIVGYPPFFDEDALCIYQKILRGKIVFPRFFPKDAKSLVKHLLCHDLVRRIGHVRDGVSDVRHHRWFQDLSFNDLYQQALTPPHIPRQTNNAFKYFGEYPEDETQAPAPAYDPFADW